MDYSAPKKRKPNVNKVSKPKAPTKGKAKGKSKELSKANLDKLSEHTEHHSKKHMAMMRKLMKEGASFSEAHKQAMAKVGK